MTGNKVQEGRLNRSRAIDLIRNRPGISRIEASEQLGLNRSTLTHIVNDLLSCGFVSEEKTAKSGERGGRIPIGLKIVERLILGVEWQDSYIRYTLSNLSGNSHKQGFIKLSGNSIGHLTIVLKDLIQNLEIEYSQIIYGMALGMPGRINPDKGIVISSLPLSLSESDLAKELLNQLGLPVLIENDANCFSWGEILGRREFDGNLICLLLQFHSLQSRQTWDQEIGIGIVQQGCVYRGSNYAAGELITSLVSDELRDKFLSSLNNEGPEAEDVREAYLSTLFKTLNPVIAALDPQKVILGGEFFQYGPQLEKALEQILPCSWCFSQKGIWEVAQGAASFFIKTIFTFPGFNDSSLLKGQWENVFKLKQNNGGNNAER